MWWGSSRRPTRSYASWEPCWRRAMRSGWGPAAPSAPALCTNFSRLSKDRREQNHLRPYDTIPEEGAHFSTTSRDSIPASGPRSRRPAATGGNGHLAERGHAAAARRGGRPLRLHARPPRGRGRRHARAGRDRRPPVKRHRAPGRLHPDRHRAHRRRGPATCHPACGAHHAARLPSPKTPGEARARALGRRAARLLRGTELYETRRILRLGHHRHEEPDRHTPLLLAHYIQSVLPLHGRSRETLSEIAETQAARQHRDPAPPSPRPSLAASPTRRSTSASWTRPAWPPARPLLGPHPGPPPRRHRGRLPAAASRELRAPPASE